MAAVLPSYNFKNARLERIPLNKIKENAEALRTQVDKESEKYKGLVDSISQHGVMNAISVREIRDPGTQEVLYGLIDGLHRFNGAMDAGLTDIPASIIDMDQANLIEAQIIANAHTIETTPVQYTKAILAVLANNPLLTVAEMAARLSRTKKWLEDRLHLVDLNEKIQPLVDAGTLNLLNAYALSKLSPEKQDEMLPQALSQPAAQFAPSAANVQAAEAKAKREGRKMEAAVFKPVERLQRLPIVRDQKDFIEKNPEQSSLLQQMKANGVTTIEQAAAYTLSWVMHIDPVTQAVDKAKWDAEQLDQANKKKAAAEKRQREKDAKAAAVAEATVGN